VNDVKVPLREAEILQAVFSALVHSGRVICWRNNSGFGRTENGNKIRFGLGIGSADIVGLVRPSGRFVGFEIKTLVGRLSAEQAAWHRVVADAGGAVFTVRSPAEALAALETL
jgi:hypothetical protein